MNAIKNLWARGAIGKIVVGLGGLTVACCACSAIALVIPTPRQQRAEATVVAAAATVETAVTARAATAAPTLTVEPPTPTAAPTDTPALEPTEAAAPDLDVGLRVSQILGADVTTIEAALGRPTGLPILAKAGELQALPDGGESRDYAIGRDGEGILTVLYDGRGVARGVFVQNLSRLNVPLDDYPQLLAALDVAPARAPDVTAPAAVRWENADGLAIAVTTGGLNDPIAMVNVWQVDTPAANAGESDGENTEKALYLLQIAPITDDISDGIKGISELSLSASREPTLLVNDDWKIRMAAQMAVLKLSAEKLRELPDAPAGLERVGDKIKTMATELDLIVENLGTGIDNLDADKIVAATEAMARTTVLAQEMTDLVESQ